MFNLKKLFKKEKDTSFVLHGKAEGYSTEYEQCAKASGYGNNFDCSKITIDVETHGKWEICCDGYYPYCSVCKEEPSVGVMTKYCPNCGAKMDFK